ncbi:MAG: L-arabinose isomerase [Planctomycetes bacterium]|nr:L-arabinose isomerase [Planctomycetota bacterium]
MPSDRPCLWFVTGSQHLYGPEALAQVAANAQAVAGGLDACGRIPLPVIAKPVLTTAEDIRSLCLAASADPQCAGLVLWMHTFSPAKMWIGGLSCLRKPFAHLHTQLHRDLPWGSIDMDFMNLHQAAHGDREGAHLHTRMRLERKVVVGHWQDGEVQDRLGAWARAALGWHDLQGARFVRFGDNMRNVAVTDGDKVAAEMRFGCAVLAHGASELADRAAQVTEADVDALVAEYLGSYACAPDVLPGQPAHRSLRTEARTELALRRFLVDGRFKGFTTNFEDLAHLPQLPGLAVQRLMADGYGFGAEGDWKSCFMLRAMKTMATGLPGGTSWMEDYTYHLEPGRELVLGAHMLEVCPSLATARPSLQVHPLGIGGKADPARLVFDARPGPAINVSLVDLGNRFRLVVADVEDVTPPAPLPRLPVARAVWRCLPDFKTACAAWLYAGGAHHALHSQALSGEHLADFAAIAGIDLVRIDARTRIDELRERLRTADVVWSFSQGLGRV